MSDAQKPSSAFGPTRPGTLLLLGLLGGVVGRWTLEIWYGELPQLSWGSALTVTAVAIYEAVAAWRVRTRMGHAVLRTPTIERPIEPLLVARLAVLAKASAVLGVLLTGLFVGALLWLWPQRDVVAAAARDVPAAVGSALAGMLLLTAALWLEHACRIPHNDSSTDTTDGVSGGDTE